MRGEQQTVEIILNVERGSPPHARGAAEEEGEEGNLIGITPACAGSSKRRGVRNSRSKDHPRMRGEQRHGDRRGQCGAGITPACAGSSA